MAAMKAVIYDTLLEPIDVIIDKYDYPRDDKRVYTIREVKGVEIHVTINTTYSVARAKNDNTYVSIHNKGACTDRELLQIAIPAVIEDCALVTFPNETEPTYQSPLF